MKKPIAIISVLLLVLAGLGTWFFLENFKRVSKERDLPAQGEARYNPLYALKLSLRELGQKADTHARLDIESLKLQAHDTLVLYAPPNGLSNTQLDALLAWVEGGGHIVLSAPNPEFLSEGDTIYTKLGIYPAESDDECLEFLPTTGKKPDFLCGSRFLVDDLEWFQWLHGDEELGYSLGRMYWGDGSITIASNLRFMGNEQLKRAGARELTYQMLASSMGKGRFHLIYSTDMSPFWLLLIKHGWTLLVPLLLLLGAWLVYRSQRFGPLQASPNQDRRALLEHIGATGEYLFHRHLSHELHLAVLALFNTTLRRRDPMTAALTGEAQIAALAERTGIDPQKIRQALKPGSLRQKENFFHSVATLIQLRNQL